MCHRLSKTFIDRWPLQKKVIAKEPKKRKIFFGEWLLYSIWYQINYNIASAALYADDEFVIPAENIWKTTAVGKSLEGGWPKEK